MLVSRVVLVLLVVAFASAALDLDISQEAIDWASDDWGHVVSNAPMGVVTPDSVNEIKQVIKYAQKRHIPVAAAGHRHSVMGQAQALDGIVIDMSHMNRTLQITQNYAVVECGATWRSLLEATLQHGLTPRIFTDYIDLSIAGTLSVGGLGAQSYRVGFQLDNVLEIEIVTGKGKVVTCSPTSNSELFHAAIGGLGQFGVITKAKIALEPAKPMNRYVRFLYSDIDEFIDDMFVMLEDERFDTVQGFVVANDVEGLAIGTGDAFPNLDAPVGDGAYLYMVEASVNYFPGNVPSVETLLQGLNNIPDADGGVNVLDLPYEFFIARLDPVEAAQRETGMWFLEHPWIDVFISREVSSSFITNELSLLGPNDVNGVILVYPLYADKINAPNTPLPDADELIVFGLLRAAFPGQFDAMNAANQAVYQRTLQVGGTGYATDAVQLDPASWEIHFGQDRYDELFDAKRKYDPAGILAPGQNVFPSVGCSSSTSSTSSSTSASRSRSRSRSSSTSESESRN